MNEEQRELVTENHNLIYSFLNLYNLPIEEYYDLAAIGLCKAAIYFDPTKSKFSTFAYECMYTSVFKEIKRAKASKRIPESCLFYYQAEIGDEDGRAFEESMPSLECVEDTVFLKSAILSFIDSLNEYEKDVLRLLSDGHTQTEIGRMLGCSQAHVSRAKIRIHNLLMQEIDGM